MRTWLVTLCVLAGCGRFGFDTAALDSAVAPDATVDAPSLDVCARVPTALYCTDFESGELGPLDVRGGNFVPVGFVGAGYEITAPPSSGSRLAFLLEPAMTAGVLHIGARIHVDATAVITTYVVVAQALAPTDEKISYDLGTMDKVQLVSTVSPGTSESSAADTFPRGRWFCLEHVIEVSDAGLTRALVDGAEKVAIPVLNTLPASGFGLAQIGAFTGANPDAVTVTIDNFIVSNDPIGCP